jgi:predicted DNA-binding transcriptional regulator AlpA
MRLKHGQRPNQRLNTFAASAVVADTTIAAAIPLEAAFMSLIRRVHETNDHCILRLADSVKKMGRANSTFWLDVKSGMAPPSIRVGKRSVGWLKAELDAVLCARALASRTGVQIDIKLFVSLLTAPRLCGSKGKNSAEGWGNA